jgi:excisionase family DNA binding protein
MAAPPSKTTRRPATNGSAPRIPNLDEIADRTTISVDQAAALLGIGRSAAYEAARRGQLPTRRLGRRLVVPVPAFFEWLGVPATPNSTASPARTRPSSG